VDDAQDPNLTALWCRAIAEELRRSGVERAVLCPGSRNSPLLHALHAQLGDGCLSHVDERSAGFIALGLAKRLEQPVVVCVTSGSAVANLLPAVVEAHAAGIPLFVISADRPWEAHDASSPQTMRQADLFGRFIVADALVGEPIADDRPLRSLRARVCWLVHHCRQDHRPVHLNVPIRDPVTPARDPSWTSQGLSPIACSGRLHGLPTVLIISGAGGCPPAIANQLRAVCDGLPAAPQGLIVAGPSPGIPAAVLADLARRTGFPLLADAPGGLREECGTVVATADAILTGDLGTAQADIVIQVGPAPLARATYEFLDRQRCPWLILSADRGNPDFLHRANAVLVQPSREDLEVVAATLGQAPPRWRERWQEAETHARLALRSAMACEPWGEVLAAHLSIAHPGFSLLHAASSMAVRHANLHCLPGIRSRPVTANRGLNGIDGTIGTFIGELVAHGGNGLLLIGDLAVLHDLPALAALAHSTLSGALVVINNDGGGIFDFLSVAQLPAYRRLVRMPHGLDFTHVAAQFGLSYQAVASAAELIASLDRAAAGPGLSLIECRVAGDAVTRHRALIARMANATSETAPS
jgi:2-succinyl-5-enolpyruvyl-6-hydroxy-3-cyclohexene-1-carboxylate synthase